MQIGDMRERIAFIRSTRTQRTDGGYDVSATTLATRWADVRPVAAREGEEAGRLAGSTTYLITLDARALPSGLTTDDRMSWATAPGGAVALNIRAIRRPPARADFVEIIGDAGVIQ